MSSTGRRAGSGGDRSPAVPPTGSAARRPGGDPAGRTTTGRTANDRTTAARTSPARTSSARTSGERPASGRTLGRISTPTPRTTQAARTAPTARTTASGRDWPRRDVDVWQHPQGRDRPPWRPVNLTPVTTGKPMSPSTRRMYRRRRRSVLLVFLLVSAIVLVVSRLGPDRAETDATAPGPTAPGPTVAAPVKATAAPTAAATKSPAKPATTRVPVTAALRGNGFDYATGPGPVLGTGGVLRRFKVAVEQGNRGTGSAADFAAAVDRTLGDPRSWIAGKQFRLQRVPRAAGAEFTVFLASAATSEKMCARGGLRTAGYTSCRLAGQVIINLDRWQQAIPNYGAPLATYQAYAINHEVGHQLGHGHEACPAPGKLAPVMQQQTYGLKGCTANAWPYVAGQRYAGAAIA